MTPATEPPLRRALYRALHDPLTGLANRALLVDRLTQALARAERRPAAAALLLLDLDDFKAVNNSLGHAAGDAVLVEIARRLEEVVRSTDTVARLGGDEFVVLAEDITGADDAAALAERLRERVAGPVELAGGVSVRVTASVGVALAAGAAQAPVELLWDADAAMYRAKDCGRDRVHIFTEGLRSSILDRSRAEQLLRRALEHDGLRLLYQPIVDLATGQMAGVEAFVRVADPDRGLVAPAEFLRAAETSGLIVPLGAWVITTAAAQAARWRAQPGFPPGFAVCVNVSGTELAHPGFLEGVIDALQVAGIDATALCFDVTENALTEAPAAALRSLQALKDLGARLAIDDFGTGHSSLTWLRRVPADLLKVDGRFVAGLGRDRGDAAIVRAVISLGHSLGLTTVAEGVETQAQLDELRALGADLAQGHLFGVPAPAESIDALFQPSGPGPASIIA